jgi:hypothetical protein
MLAAWLLAGCATRAVDVVPLAADPTDFLPWPCVRVHDELDGVQQRAVELAWTVDQRAGQHVVALGIGLTVFWPALLAMRPDGAESQELARLKGRYEALNVASRRKGCAADPATLADGRGTVLPVLPGERLVYEERQGVREPLHELALNIVALRRDEIEFGLDAPLPLGRWRQDMAGNVIEAPAGTLVWRHLLRRQMALGDVLVGDIGADSAPRARVRGQVVALGPQLIAGRRFDAAVIELFGDIPEGQASTRLDGAIVVDRATGVLLRLDLYSAQPQFRVQRRLVRVDELLH